MKKKTLPHWIAHEHFFDGTEYECSVCGERSRSLSRKCPECGTELSFAEKQDDWLDELMEIDLILGD